jgi:hypothetical protein
VTKLLEHNRGDPRNLRRKMMQQWADYLDKLKTGAEIVPIRQSS